MQFPVRPFRSLVPFAAVMAVIGSACAARTETTSTTRHLAPGIVYTQEITTGDAPLIINSLRVDLKAPGVRVRCGQAQDAITLNGPTRGREQLHSLANRNGAVAAVNADFFPFTGDPLGLAIRDGELLSEPMEYRACLGIGTRGVLIDILSPVGVWKTADNFTGGLDGINRVAHDNEVVALTPSYSAAPTLGQAGVIVTLKDVNLPVKVSLEIQGTVAGIGLLAPKEPLPLCPPGFTLLIGTGKAGELLHLHANQGDTLRFRFDLTPNTPAPDRGKYPSRAAAFRGRTFLPAWTDIEQAVGGGPWLVKNGQISVDGEAEGMAKDDFIERRHPRTAAGVTADGRLLLVTVDGRETWSRGASLPELAAIMQRLGAVNAINFDGGGSTTMVVGGSVVNAPTDGRERAIANSLLIFSETSGPAEEDSLLLAPSPADVLTVRAGETLPLKIADAAGTLLDPKTPILWGTKDGLGFVSQKGMFTSHKIGVGSVLARVGSKQIAIPVQVLPDAPFQLRASLGAVANNPPDRNLLIVTLLDRFGNPIRGQKVTANMYGGELLGPLNTGEDGKAMAEVVWDALPEKRMLTAAAGNLRSSPIRWKPIKSNTSPVKEPIDSDDRKP